jgi:MFS family permease
LRAESIEQQDGGRAELAGAPGRERLWGRDFSLLLVTNVVLYVAFHTLTPTLPLYAVELGGGTAIAGLVMGLYTGAAVLVRSFAGWALDAHGRRLLLLLGVVTFALASLGYHWATAIPLLLALRLFHGMSFGVYTVASGTLASDLVPRSRLGEGMGFVGVSWGLSLAIGPAVGLAMLSRGGFGFLFNGATLLSVGALALALLLRYPRLEHERRPFSWAALIDRSSLFSSGLTFLLTASYGLVLAFVTLYAVEREVANVGLFFTVFAAVLTASRLFTGRLADLLGFAPLVCAGFILVALSLVVLSQATELTLFLVAATLFALGFGATQPSLLAMAVSSVPPSRRGAANAAFLSAYDLGISAGSIGGGLVASTIGLAQLYLLGAAAPLAAVTAVLMHERGRLRSDPPGTL